MCSWEAYTVSFGWEVVISLKDFTFHGTFMEFGGKIWIQLTDAEIVSRKVLNGQTKGVKRGRGQSGPFLSLQAKQAVRLQYVLLLSLPPLAELLLLSAHCPFQIFPPFAMNALNAWICTTKPHLHPPPTKRGSKLYTLFHYWGIWHCRSIALL